MAIIIGHNRMNFLSVNTRKEKKFLKSFLIEDILSFNDKNDGRIHEEDTSGQLNSKQKEIMNEWMREEQDFHRQACLKTFNPIALHSKTAASRELLHLTSSANQARHAQFDFQFDLSPLVRRIQRKLSPPKTIRSTNPSNSSNSDNTAANPLNDLIQMTSSTIKDMDLEQKPTNLTDSALVAFYSRQLAFKRRRKTRTAFTASQIQELERRFQIQKYLTPSDRDDIATALTLSNAQVITWFQNRRAKLKREVEELKNDLTAAKSKGCTSHDDDLTDEEMFTEQNI